MKKQIKNKEGKEDIKILPLKRGCFGGSSIVLGKVSNMCQFIKEWNRGKVGTES